MTGYHEKREPRFGEEGTKRMTDNGRIRERVRRQGDEMKKAQLGTMERRGLLGFVDGLKVAPRRTITTIPSEQSKHGGYGQIRFSSGTHDVLVLVLYSKPRLSVIIGIDHSLLVAFCSQYHTSPPRKSRGSSFVRKFLFRPVMSSWCRTGERVGLAGINLLYPNFPQSKYISQLASTSGTPPRSQRCKSEGGKERLE